MVDTAERQRSPGSRARDTSSDSVIVELAEQLLAESDKLARNIKEDAEREAEVRAANIVGEAEAKAASIVDEAEAKADTTVGEAERRAAELVSTATDKSERIESEARAKVHRIVQKAKAGVESSVVALDNLFAPDEGRSEGSTSPPERADRAVPPQGVGRTVLEDAPQGPRTPRLQGYDIRSGVARRAVANGH